MSPFRRQLRSLFLPDRERFRAPIITMGDRVAAWFDMLVVDAGILRLIWKNRAKIGPFALRMNQPWPADIASAKAMGIRSVISARHDSRHGGHALEAEACEKAGLAYHVLDQTPIFSREAPSRESILNVADILEHTPHPVLIHCKSGADRAGFVSALYRITLNGEKVREARKELSLKHLHIKQSKAGILDAVFDAYLAAYPDESKPFLDWVREEYDPAALQAAFKAGKMADFLDQVILRHE